MHVKTKENWEKEKSEERNYKGSKNFASKIKTW